jgi:hypothetical protein
VDHVLHPQDLLGDGGELVLGGGPDQPGLADGVGFGFVVAVVVGDAALVEVVEDLDLAVAAEELLVGAERFGGGSESVLDALPQPDLLLDLLVRDQVEVDGVGLLSDAVDAAGALDDPDDGPGQVVVDDDVAVLQVLTFGEDVGGDEDVDRVARPRGTSSSVWLGSLFDSGEKRRAISAGLSVSPVARATLRRRRR